MGDLKISDLRFEIGSFADWSFNPEPAATVIAGAAVAVGSGLNDR
jgi:hypothetical protein